MGFFDRFRKKKSGLHCEIRKIENWWRWDVYDGNEPVISGNANSMQAALDAAWRAGNAEHGDWLPSPDCVQIDAD